MSNEKPAKKSLSERLLEASQRVEASGIVARGVEKLPVAADKKATITQKTNAALLVSGETGAALIDGASAAGKGAAVAAHDSAAAFKESRDDSVSRRKGTPVPERATSGRSGGDDVMAQLDRAVELHDAGRLTDDEFAAFKARILAGEGSSPTL